MKVGGKGVATPSSRWFDGLVPLKNLMTDIVHPFPYILILLLRSLPAVFLSFCTIEYLRKYIAVTCWRCRNLIKDALQRFDDRDDDLRNVGTGLFRLLTVETECLAFILEIVVVVFQSGCICHVESVAEILHQKQAKRKMH